MGSSTGQTVQNESYMLMKSCSYLKCFLTGWTNKQTAYQIKTVSSVCLYVLNMHHWLCSATHWSFNTAPAKAPQAFITMCFFCLCRENFYMWYLSLFCKELVLTLDSSNPHAWIIFFFKQLLQLIVLIVFKLNKVHLS